MSEFINVKQILMRKEATRHACASAAWSHFIGILQTDMTPRQSKTAKNNCLCWKGIKSSSFTRGRLRKMNRVDCQMKERFDNRSNNSSRSETNDNVIVHRRENYKKFSNNFSKDRENKRKTGELSKKISRETPFLQLDRSKKIEKSNKRRSLMEVQRTKTAKDVSRIR